MLYVNVPLNSEMFAGDRKSVHACILAGQLGLDDPGRLTKEKDIPFSGTHCERQNTAFNSTTSPAFARWKF